MRTAGIIAEYNPITNGHIYHLEKTRQISKADFVVAVMSGDFTQRGMPAVMDKWTRSRLAAECGIDLVVELPFVYATGSAELFARGGVRILESLGVVDTLSFGSESGDLCKLTRLADLLRNEPAPFKEALKRHLKTGVSFPKARQMAVADMTCSDLSGRELAKLLESPNNILAIEYLKQIRNLEPVTVRRLGEYNDTAIPEKSGNHSDSNIAAGFAGPGAEQTGALASASAVRAAFAEGRFDEIAGAVPEICYEVLKRCSGGYAAGRCPGIPSEDVNCEDKTCANSGYTNAGIAGETAESAIFKNRNSDSVYFDLLRTLILRSPAEEIRQISGVSEGIENRIKKEIRNHSDYDSYADSIKTKRFTRTAIDRMLLHILTGLSSVDHDACRSMYARVLAFNGSGAQLIKRAKAVSRIPVITNINKEMPDDPLLRRALEYDILASDIYNIIQGNDLYKNSDYVKMPFAGG